jgi:hypothetical protein
VLSFNCVVLHRRFGADSDKIPEGGISTYILHLSGLKDRVPAHHSHNTEKKRLGSDLNLGLVGDLLDEADYRSAVSTLQRLTPHNHHGGLGLPFRQRALNLSALVTIRRILV